MAAAKFTMSRDEIIEHARAIAIAYQAQDLTLTLRQMYYQFVARGLAPSGLKVYKRIGAALTAARYDGRFPVDWLEDRGRSIDPGAFTRNDDHVSTALQSAAGWLPRLPNVLLDRHRWYAQPVHVSVWVEKEALSGVFQPVCNKLGVSWFACKGYPSVSALKQWVDLTDLACGGASERWRYNYGPRWGGKLPAVERRGGLCERAVVLYFGDFDPDGWEIPRSAERNIEKLRALARRQENPFDEDEYSDEWDDWNHGAEEEAYPVEFIRVALNMDQIEQYDPPPFDAKMTSARYASYVAEHDTDSAWELDALEPTVLRQLIRDHVESYFDEEIHEDNVEEIAELRETMLERMRADGWADDALE